MSVVRGRCPYSARLGTSHPARTRGTVAAPRRSSSPREGAVGPSKTSPGDQDGRRGRCQTTVFADGVVATAILDRLVHHATVVNIRGQSYRMRTHVPSPREGAAMLG